MSKKSFVTMALICNLIICIMICILYFNGYGKSNRTGSESKNETTNIAESGKQQDSSGKETEIDRNETTVKDKDTEKTTQSTEPDSTTESETTTKNNRETTSQAESTIGTGENEQTTTSAFVNGKTIAVISSACNVRDGANVSSNVIGITRTGEEYIINASKSDNNWIAIVYNGTIGYISTGYCVLK